MWFKYTLILILFIHTSCTCYKQYAKIHVVTNDPTKGSIGLKIFDAKSGLNVGDGITPVDFIITKQSCQKNPTLSLIVFDKCYPIKWKLVEVTKWTSDLSDTNNAINTNNISITVREDKDCIWDN